MSLDFIQDNEQQLRLGVFFAVFLGMALLETWKPRRKRLFSRLRRWVGNLGLLLFSGLLARLVLPWVPVSAALYAQAEGWGLFNSLQWGMGLEVILAVLMLDFLIYAQHVAMHKVPLLWRLHRLHHADLDYDVTTGIRFHPIEIILSLLYKMGLVLILGVHPVAVIVFEIILNGMAMFNHANFRLPLGLDRVLRLVVVTPDMHRVHHSSTRFETDSNYGFSVSLWDRLCRTYIDQPAKGHQDMEIGLEYFREAKDLSLGQMLFQPFRKSE